MAHGQTLELRKIGGITVEAYCLPGQTFDPPRTTSKRVSWFRKKQAWRAMKAHRKLAAP